MGSIFKYIADGSIEPSDLGECQHCEREGQDSYDYFGEIIDPDLAANPSLARREKEISAACVDCIAGGNLRKSSVEVERISAVIEQCDADLPSLLARYHTIPDIIDPDDDWPICCDDWTEYCGQLEQLHSSAVAVGKFQWWEKGHRNESILDITTLDQADSEAGISLFACPQCGKGWFTHVTP